MLHMSHFVKGFFHFFFGRLFAPPKHYQESGCFLAPFCHIVQAMNAIETTGVVEH